jgi:hypothetical protein
MTERHPPPRRRRLEEVAGSHPTEGSLKKVGAGGAVSATMVKTCGLISSGEPEGC